MSMLWNYLKTNFRPSLNGIPASSNSTTLSNCFIKCLSGFSKHHGVSFVSRCKPMEFLLDGLVCDLTSNVSLTPHIPKKIYYGIEWEWDSTKFNDFVTHDLNKLY